MSVSWTSAVNLALNRNSASHLVGEACICENYKLTTNCSLNTNNQCECTSIGAQNSVICSKLATKCLVMKAEMTGTKSGRRARPEGAFQNNDGLYDPDCDEKGLFKAKQCNGTTTCWCVNTAGVRRTDKDTEISCTERVRTYWIIIELKHKTRETPYDTQSLQKYVLLNYILVARESLGIGDTTPSHAKPGLLDHDLSLNQVQAGIIAVIVVVTLAVIAGIVVLVISRKNRMAKYEKAEVNELLYFKNPFLIFTPNNHCTFLDTDRTQLYWSPFVVYSP
nr:epithelial cell adhesion molecule [Vulpes vulpes]